MLFFSHHRRGGRGPAGGRCRQVKACIPNSIEIGTSKIALLFFPCSLMPCPCSPLSLFDPFGCFSDKTHPAGFLGFRQSVRSVMTKWFADPEKLLSSLHFPPLSRPRFSDIENHAEYHMAHRKRRTGSAKPAFLFGAVSRCHLVALQTMCDIRGLGAAGGGRRN